MKKSFALTAFSLVIAIVIIVLYYNTRDRLNVKPSQNNESQQQRESTNFKGPSGQPYIKGPGAPPPASE